MLSIQNNMLAWNAVRQLNICMNKKAKNAEKLSSGYKINRAADDAAGLAISEKMRRQIRGLQKGLENIQDGISLVQTAEGALDEITDMLQRINELSVKAYNGTNTREDQEYIQAEVTQIIKEIERVADDTTFNEMQILKGNPREMVKVVADKVSVIGYAKQTVEKEVPKWLSDGVDKKLEQHSAYTGLTQETGGRMIRATATDAAGIVTSGVYYGPKNEGTLYGIYTYAGAWTSTMNDNPTAKISFAGLCNTESTEDLWQKMQDLLGCAIGVPCGTCDDRYYSIGFEGEVDGYSASPGKYRGNSAGNRLDVQRQGIVNLSRWMEFEIQDEQGNTKNVNCFDKIADLIKKQKKGTDDGTLDDAARKQQVRDLADEMARRLRDRSYRTMVGVTDNEGHFDRAVKTGDYDIIVYDYRDTSVLNQQTATSTEVNTWASCDIKIPITGIKPGLEVEIERPLQIVCSSEFNDKIPIDLPLINADTLGITGYDVSRYTEDVAWHSSEAYNEYQASLQAWENDYHMEQKIIPGRTYSYAVMVSPPIRQFDENGEFKGMHYEYEMKEGKEPDRTVSYKVYNRPRPTPPVDRGFAVTTTRYDPDSNRRIKDALEYVLACRSNLGAAQNRLEHAYQNNQNKEENTAAAESLIRDTDIAKEMVQYSGNNIVQQAGISILSQANQSSQMILQLLQ